MRVKIVTISDEVLTVLRASKIDADGLHLPGQLDPKAYQKIKKVLEANGLKWNRGKGTHVFTDANAQSRISAVVENGNFIDEKKSYDFFETPEHVAADMAELIFPAINLPTRDCKRVLEPSAGKGRLLRALKYGCAPHAVELNPECVKELRRQEFNVIEADFLQLRPTLEQCDYHGVIMNPPFSNGQDVEHVCHAMQFLRKGGRLAAIVSPAYTFRTGAKWDAFRKMLDANKVIVEKELPSGTFKESGTNVRTMLLCLEKK